MKHLKLVILKDNEIDEFRFRELIRLEHETWPEGDSGHLPEEYLRKLYENDKKGLFLAVDLDTDRLAGYFNAIFITPENFRTYLNQGDFTLLERTDPRSCDQPVLYLYTANLYPAYRGTSCMVKLGKAFTRWLDMAEAGGIRLRDVYAEAVTRAGARTIVKGFGMTAMDDVDNIGLGHYENHDGLRKYRDKMRKR